MNTMGNAGASDLTGLAWRKSSRSQGDGQCVEVAGLPAAVVVRDSKNESGPALVFTPGAWDVFVAGVKAGEFDAR